MYMYDWFTLLYSRIQHDIVSQLLGEPLTEAAHAAQAPQ